MYGGLICTLLQKCNFFFYVYRSLLQKYTGVVAGLFWCIYSWDVWRTHLYSATGWRRLIGSLKLQIIFHKRATNYRALLRKMTHKDKGSYESWPPCSRVQVSPPYIPRVYTSKETCKKYLYTSAKETYIHKYFFCIFVCVDTHHFWIWASHEFNIRIRNSKWSWELYTFQEYIH